MPFACPAAPALFSLTVRNDYSTVACTLLIVFFPLSVLI